MFLSAALFLSFAARFPVSPARRLALSCQGGLPFFLRSSFSLCYKFTFGNHGPARPPWHSFRHRLTFFCRTVPHERTSEPSRAWRTTDFGIKYFAFAEKKESGLCALDIFRFLNEPHGTWLVFKQVNLIRVRLWAGATCSNQFSSSAREERKPR